MQTHASKRGQSTTDADHTAAVREEAELAVARWRLLTAEREAQQRARALALDASRSVLTGLPRRQPVAPSDPSAMLTASAPLRENVSRKAPFWRAGFRLLRWIWVLFVFAISTLIDQLRGKDLPAVRAKRLRHSLERLGGTFLKLGQQLSIRVDLLPEVYCHEFGRLLDRVPSFPTEDAIAIIEESLNRPLKSVFSEFDPKPIGSASIACVYQARLLTGERVAVKVRRPGIVRTFAADWRALGWLAQVVEMLTLVRKGQVSTVIRDLRTMIDEELDFQIEARNTELFKRKAHRAKLRGVSTPNVYFDHSTDRILVTEFISGLWLWEALDAVEHGNDKALALMHELDIDPNMVARRLYRASLFGIFDSHIFHADPHPANVVVRSGSEVVLVDFGSCGSFSNHQVRLMRQFHVSKSQDDLGGMVKCILALLEPLPPVDVDTLSQRISEVLLSSLRAIDSPNAAWWERTSAGIWLSFMKVVRAYDIRVDLDVLRMIRSTLLYDTIALRLDPSLDIYREYQSYRDAVARRSRKRFVKSLRELAEGGVDDRWFLRLEEGAHMLQRGLHHLERALDAPTYRFMFLAGKTVFALRTMVSWLGLSLLVATGTATLVCTWQIVAGTETLSSEMFSAALAVTLRNGFFLGFVGLALLLSLRLVLIRMREPEI